MSAPCRRTFLALFGLLVGIGLRVAPPSVAADFRGAQFIGLTNFADFHSTREGTATVLTSPILRPQINWDELIVSWNLVDKGEVGLKVEVRALPSSHPTRFYTLGLWSRDGVKHPRESVKGQKDADGEVDTDTLKIRETGAPVEVRLTFEGAPAPSASLKLLGLSFSDSSNPAPLPPNKAAWGKSLAMIARSQGNYPGGAQSWCSPTSVSMVMNFWSRALGDPKLDFDVPAVVRGVNDPNWPGTGNWPFNTAFAGAQPGLRAFVTRFTDISELEDWIVAGLPVVTSVSYSLLQGRSQKGNGHLVVCVGFTPEGDILVNDPGTTKQVRRVFRRENMVKAWAESRNTVYLILPAQRPTPPDRFGHWRFAGVPGPDFAPSAGR